MRTPLCFKLRQATNPRTPQHQQRATMSALSSAFGDDDTVVMPSTAWSPPLLTKGSTLPPSALVEPYDFPETGRGLRCKRAVAMGEVLIEVPLADCWHAADARKCAALQPLLQSGVPLSDFDASALQLLLARADPSGLSELRRAHLEEMPKEYNSTLYWSAAELEELKGSPWHGLAQRFAEEAAADWAALQALVSGAVTLGIPEAGGIPEEAHGDGDSSAAASGSAGGFLAAHGITWEGYLWAYATLKSRAAEANVDGVAGVRLLAPGFDLINHSASLEPVRPPKRPTLLVHRSAVVSGARSTRASSQGTTHRFDDKRRALQVIAPKPYAEGEQAFISYGGASNGSLLLAGGFVLPSNRFDHVELCERDPPPPLNPREPCRRPCDLPV